MQERKMKKVRCGTGKKIPFSVPCFDLRVHVSHLDRNICVVDLLGVHVKRYKPLAYVDLVAPGKFRICDSSSKGSGSSRGGGSSVGSTRARENNCHGRMDVECSPYPTVLAL